NPFTDKWNISDAAADFLYTGGKLPEFALPGTLKIVCNYESWLKLPNREGIWPLINTDHLKDIELSGTQKYFLEIDADTDWSSFSEISSLHNAVLCVRSNQSNSMASVRRWIAETRIRSNNNAVILVAESTSERIDEQLIHFATETG